jgi:LysM repeat protein
MSASKTNLVAVLATTAILLMASTSFAKDKNNNGGPPPRPKKDSKVTSTTLSSTALGVAQGATLISDPGKKKPVPGGTYIGNLNGVTSLSGDKGSGITITHGGNPPRSPESCKWKNKYWYCDHSHHIVFCDHFVEPAFANYVVVPGDTLELISIKLFRTPEHTLFLASLNRVPVNVALIPGQVLVVPAF